MRSVSLSARRERVNRASQPYSSNRYQGGSRRVYVGNLSWEVSWQDLKDHMRSAGKVVRADVMLDYTGRSKGCGIVEFSSSREANEAIRNLNETELKGRKIFIREDREEAPSHPTGRSNAPHHSQSSTFVVTKNGAPSGVVVENLPSNYAWKDLKDVFKPAGFVVRADIITNTPTGSIGVVDFKSHNDAKHAVNQFNNYLVGGNVISVRLRGTESDAHDEAGDDEDMEGSDADDVSVGDESSSHRIVNTSTAVGRKLYVGQLSWSVSWQDLKDHFKPIGNVIRADVATDKATGRSKGFGTVEFATVEEAQRAIEELNNSDLAGRSIWVRPDREQREGH